MNRLLVCTVERVRVGFVCSPREAFAEVQQQQQQQTKGGLLHLGTSDDARAT